MEKLRDMCREGGEGWRSEEICVEKRGGWEGWRSEEICEKGGGGMEK